MRIISLPMSLLLLIAFFLRGNDSQAKSNQPTKQRSINHLNPASGALQHASADKLTLHQIQNAVYRLPTMESGHPDQLLKMTAGHWKNGEETAQLETAAFGDLDKDGKSDAAVVFFWNGGGSGHFKYLEVFLNKHGKPVALEPKVVGDRVGIRGIYIKNGTITLDALSHGPGEGACCPTVKKSAKYRLVKGELTGPESLY